MDKEETRIVKFFENEISKFLPGNSVDCVIFGYNDYELKVLLLKLKTIEQWALPGGFIYKDEDLDKAALRVLRERTNLDYPFLEQFYTFGNYNRRRIQEFMKILENTPFNTPIIRNWFQNRFITTAYLALVDINQCNIKPGIFSSACEWKPISKLPELMFDHNMIIEKALDKIRMQINYLPVSKSLLQEKFTMNELQKLYEAILQKKLDRANFQKKILKLGVLVRLEKKYTGGSHKAPYLYKFDEQKYNNLVKKGIGFL